MSKTDSAPFQDHTAAMSVRENRRLYEVRWRGPEGYGARGTDPLWHQPSDVLVNSTDWDYLLGFHAVQMTLGATAQIVGLGVEP